MRCAITFVCQPGELEAKAVLLAASLRRRLVGDADLVACLPVGRSGRARPARHTLRALESLGVVTIPVRNPISDSYPIGNKIACLDAGALSTATPERIVFLDSDILCTSPFEPQRQLSGAFSAKAADFATFAGGAADWSRIYRLFGLADPTWRVTATVSCEETWPYFNAGVIGVRADSELAGTWADSCRRIDAETWVPSRRPHLDQIALPIAAARCGLDVTLLDETLNYPVHLRPLRPTLPALCHYHGPAVAAREPRLVHEIAVLVDDHPALRPVLAADPAWAVVPLPARRRWWSIRHPPTTALIPPPPAAPNDIPAESLDRALASSPTPAMLQSLVDVSRRRFGWFTRHPSRAFEYPWVASRLGRLRAGAVVDVGAGVSPLPLFLALRGLRPITVDDSTLIRDPAAGMDGWDEWGFLDYARLDPNIRAVNGDAADLDLPDGSCAAAYSVSVVEHMPAVTRRRLWPRLADWLAADAPLVLTVDLIPDTDRLWNRASGHEVEPTEVHGDLAELAQELALHGFDLDERVDLRGLPGMRADVALLAFVKSRPSRAARAPRRWFDAAPIVIGGVGGSGTRVVAKMVEALGYFVGDDLNEALDNMRLARRFDEIQSRVPGPPDGTADLSDILETFERDMFAACRGRRQPSVGWGWKVPANFFILPQLARHFGPLKYIHVIRHGLDMAFSSNQNQTRNFGRHYGVDATSRPLPEASLAYWLRANTFALDTARRLGVDHLVLNFDHLCLDPAAGVADLLRFLGRDGRDAGRLQHLVEPPSSIGRHRSADLSFLTAADRQAVRDLGFDVP